MLIAAVADGAGSARSAEVGATVAAQATVHLLERLMWDCSDVIGLPSTVEDGHWQALFREAFDGARAAVEREAQARAASPRDLATTLIAAIVTPGLAAAAQVGDGATVIADVNGNLFTLTTPSHGEYINETTFLVSPDAVENLRPTVWRGAVGRLAVFSDGLQMLALRMPDGAPHPPFFRPLFDFVANASEQTAQCELEQFLRSSRVTQRTEDDLTLLLAALIGDGDREDNTALDGPAH
jgi:hypothetical protein